jgi:hypothetical protein
MSDWDDFDEDELGDFEQNSSSVSGEIKQRTSESDKAVVQELHEVVSNVQKERLERESHNKKEFQMVAEESTSKYGHIEQTKTQEGAITSELSSPAQSELARIYIGDRSTNPESSALLFK